VIVLSVQSEGDDLVVTVAPVTHTNPSCESGAVEIPIATKRRLGLDDERSWIITTEVNRFIWPGPDLRPIARSRPGEFAYGFLPRILFDQVKAQIIQHVRTRRMRTVGRS
jgi:hypothetical protein